MAFLSMTRILFICCPEGNYRRRRQARSRRNPHLENPAAIAYVGKPTPVQRRHAVPRESEFVLLTAATVCPPFMRGYDAGAGDEASLAMAEFGGINSMLLISRNSAPIYTG